MIFFNQAKVLYHLYQFARCRNGQGLKVVQVLIYDLYHTYTTYTGNRSFGRKNKAKTCTTQKNRPVPPGGLEFIGFRSGGTGGTAKMAFFTINLFFCLNGGQ